MLRLASLILLASFAGCRQTPPTAATSDQGGRLSGIDERYQPQLAALASSVRDRDDLVANRLASRLRMRLSADASRGQAAAEDALDLLRGFEQILEGRRLVKALELELVTRMGPEEGALVVLLRCRAGGLGSIELRPGAALLRISRTALSPEGQESRSVRTLGLPALSVLSIGEEWFEVPLGTFSTAIPSNALGARTLWSLDLLAGDIQRGEGVYPAQEVLVEGVERVDLAPFLPNSAIDPADLAAYAQRPGCALAPLLERTVRVVPSRRDEALDLLTPLLESMVAEEIDLLVPSLRWLSRTGSPGRDPMAWRAWLRRRSLIRQEVRWP